MQTTDPPSLNKAANASPFWEMSLPTKLLVWAFWVTSTRYFSLAVRMQHFEANSLLDKPCPLSGADESAAKLASPWPDLDIGLRRAKFADFVVALIEHVDAVQGIRLLKPDFALAVKVKCSYLRQDDVEGIEKQASDLRDAIFWAGKLKEAGLTISDSCAKL